MFRASVWAYGICGRLGIWAWPGHDSPTHHHHPNTCQPWTLIILGYSLRASIASFRLSYSAQHNSLHHLQHGSLAKVRQQETPIRPLSFPRLLPWLFLRLAPLAPRWSRRRPRIRQPVEQKDQGAPPFFRFRPRMYPFELK